ncbi:anti-sigma factor family protein [Candidatus Palauibacter sp.]|uniref:anti-sigma factor family protein n=1 Tax=Candidatus Palauibacter sp. TaxID=3101350 RepID=UPI003B016735
MGSDANDVHPDERTLNRFADDELAERSSAAVRSHLRACDACRRQVQFIRELNAAIRAVPTPRPPADLAGRLFPETPTGRTVVPLPLETRSRAGSFLPARLRALFAAGRAAGAAVVARLSTGVRRRRIRAP